MQSLCRPPSWTVAHPCIEDEHSANDVSVGETDCHETWSVEGSHLRGNHRAECVLPVGLGSRIWGMQFSAGSEGWKNVTDQLCVGVFPSPFLGTVSFNLLQHLGVVKAFAVLREPPTALPYVEQIARGGCCGWQGGARALSLAKRAREFRIAIMRPHITQRKENSRGKLDFKKSPIASWELLSSFPGDLCGISSR